MTGQAGTAPRNPRSDALSSFDYAAPAEMFIARNTFVRGGLSYRRFTSAALAIRFAIEEIPARLRGGAVMEVREARFDHRAIRDLYEGLSYPLLRHQPFDEQVGQRTIHCEAHKGNEWARRFNSSRALGDRATDGLRKDSN